VTRGYKVSLLTALYLAQGLPFGFFAQALPVLLREAGLSLKAISATSLLGLPWALKFLCAPFVDQRGTSRQWLLPLQLASVVGALVLSATTLEGNLTVVFAAAFVFSAIAACQDIATDGLAVRILDTRERGLANGIQTGAYRVGMVLGGGWLLWVFAKSGWSTMFVCMAAVLAVTILPVLRLREPDRPPPALRSGTELALGWWPRLRAPGFATLIVLVCLYRFGDSMVASLIGPFLHDQGLSKEAIALMKGTVGSTMALAGSVAGGWFAFRAGRRAAMLACGLLQTASLAFYVAAAAGLGGVSMLWAGNVAEHLLGGMATVAVFTLMMDASNPRHASTDYALLASAVVITTAVANFVGASIADAAGYVSSFAAGCALSAAGCLLLVRAIDARWGPERLQAVWSRTTSDRMTGRATA